MANPVIVDTERWSRERYHTVLGGKNVWKVDYDGIRVSGEWGGARRTKGEPTTLRAIRRNYDGIIWKYAQQEKLEPWLLAAVIAIESGGRAEAEREEPKIKDVSIGLMQTLTATALGIAGSCDDEGHELRKLLPKVSVPHGGDLLAWSQALCNPWTSISLGARYLRMQDDRFDCQGDPVLLYACYNAGSLRTSKKNDWGVVSYGKAMDHFTRWYGDAKFVYHEAPELYDEQ